MLADILSGKVFRIECLAELLLGLHVNVEQLAEMVKLEAGVALFEKGHISCGMEARWLDMNLSQKERSKITEHASSKKAKKLSACRSYLTTSRLKFCSQAKNRSTFQRRLSDRIAPFFASVNECL